METLIDAHHPIISVLEPVTSTSLLGYAEKNRHAILEKLERYGGVLIRGLFLENPQQLASLNEALYGNTLSFLGGVSPRENPNGNSFGVSIVPCNMMIPQHRERNYLPNSPSRASFYCQQPARFGGFTPITDFEAVHTELQKIATKTMSKLASENIYFNIVYWNSKYWAEKHNITIWGWQQRFDCDSEQAMEVLAESLNISVMHYPAYSVAESHVPLSTLHPTRDTQVIYPFFYHNKRAIPEYYNLNEMQLYYFKLMLELCRDDDYEVLTGPKQAIPLSFIKQYHEAVKRYTYSFEWQAGDCLLLDNDWLGHGRTPFYGKRDHWVSLSNTK